MQSSKQFEKTLESQSQKLLAWHSFLKLSNSYLLAIRLKAGLLSKAEIAALPPNFDQVLLTYDKFGDVWAETAESWYEENALAGLEAIKGANQPKILSSLFAGNEEKTAVSLARHVVGAWAQQGKQPELLISIPVNAKKSDIHKLLDEALEDLRLDVVGGVIPAGQDLEKKLDFDLLDTKVRIAVLKKMHGLVVLKAAEPQLLNWQRAQRLGLAPAHVVKIVKAHELEVASGKLLQMADRATGEKLNVNALVGRYMRKAFLLAENAAFGKFPCFDELPKVNGEIVKTSFDYAAIATASKREYYRLHGAQPDKKKYRPDSSYSPDLDNWWENAYFQIQKPLKEDQLFEADPDGTDGDEWPDEGDA